MEMVIKLQPWQMNADELVELLEEIKAGGSKRGLRKVNIEPWQIRRKPFIEANVIAEAWQTPKYIADMHKSFVKSALKNNKSVPIEVLKDYPQLNLGAK